MGKINNFFIRHPFLRGMVSYTIMWPAANLMHQTRDKSRTNYDLWEAARYGAVGVTFVLPVYYTWLKNINRLIPATDWKTCIKKVILEQTFYWPVAITVFFAGMNLYDGSSFQHFKDELRQKYVKTHLTGLCFWPFVAPVINYSNLIAPHNRVPLAATASFIWATFLSYVKDLETKARTQKKDA